MTRLLMALLVASIAGCNGDTHYSDDIAYTSVVVGSPQTDIVHREIGHTATTNVTDTCLGINATGCFAAEPAYSPDGRRIAFRLAPWMDNGAANAPYQVWMADPDGSNPVQVTVTSGAFEPAWSGDGTKLAFRTIGGDIAVVDLCTATLPTGGPTVVVHDGAHPTWSQPPADTTAPMARPVGDSIAFESSRDGGDLDIYVLDVASGNVTRLTTDPADDRMPAWTKAGAGRERIAFVSNRNGSDDIYTMTPDGANVQRITTDPGQERNPDWSAGGIFLTYTEDDGQGVTIHRITYDGRNDRALWDGVDPTWRQTEDQPASCGSRGTMP